jgi:hypothetical protein
MSGESRDQSAGSRASQAIDVTVKNRHRLVLYSVRALVGDVLYLEDYLRLMVQ